MILSSESLSWHLCSTNIRIFLFPPLLIDSDAENKLLTVRFLDRPAGTMLVALLMLAA